MKKYRVSAILVVTIAGIVAITMLFPRYPKLIEAGQATNTAAVGQINSVEERRLIQSYAVATNSQDKLRISKALAMKGGDEAVAFFTNLLLYGYSDKPITKEEEISLTQCVKIIGFLSSKSDAAYEFVNAGTDPSFWQQQRLWRSRDGVVRDYLLVAHSIQALGLSGRPDAVERIERLAREKPADYHRTWSGSVASAVYYHAMIEKMGTERFLSDLFMKRETTERFLEWSETAEGRHWREWVKSTLQ